MLHSRSDKRYDLSLEQKWQDQFYKSEWIAEDFRK